MYYLKAADLEKFQNALLEEFVLVLGVNNFFYFGEHSVMGRLFVIQIKYKGEKIFSLF